jgi:hypothetical protein
LSGLSIQWCLCWVVSPGVGPQPNSQGGKNANFGLFLSWPMHQKCCGKQSHQDHFAGSRDFIMLADSGEVSSQSLEPHQCQEMGCIPLGRVKQPEVFFSIWVFGSYRKTSWLQDFPPFHPLIECGYSYRKLTGLSGGCNTAELA